MLNYSRSLSNSFLWIFLEVIDALNQLWKGAFSTIVCTAVALIKHSAYANEELFPSRPSRSLLYNEVDEDGSVNLIAVLV